MGSQAPGPRRAPPQGCGQERRQEGPWPPTPHLLGRPEGGLGLLVHLPDVVVLDGEDDEPAGVLPQQRLLLLHAPRHLEWRENSSGRCRVWRETEGHRPPRGRRAGRTGRTLQGRRAGQDREIALSEKGPGRWRDSLRERGWGGL